MIVVDSRFSEDDARLRRFFADLAKDGSPYSRLERIVEGLFLGPSQYSIGLQCADLICAITAAAERGNGQARGYLKTLLPRLRYPSGDRRPRRCRHQALPRTGAAAACGDEALLTGDRRNSSRYACSSAISTKRQSTFASSYSESYVGALKALPARNAPGRR